MTDGPVLRPVERLRSLSVGARIVLGSGLLSAVFVAGGWHSPLRVAVGLGFLLFGPGYLIAELLRIEDWPARISVAFAASVGLSTLAATALVYADALSPGPLLTVLLAITGGLCARLLSRRSC